MTERNGLSPMTDDADVPPETGADLELIVEYLNRHLDPARAAQVRQRLDDDPAFRDLAAPLILTWSLPKHLEQYPRPAGELEKDWDEFTRRAGFAHQRRKARRRRLWLLGIALVIVGAGLFAARGRIAEWVLIRRDFVAVPHDTGWAALGPAQDSLFVRLGAGATLRRSREPINVERHILLTHGTAHFRVAARDSLRRDGQVLGVRVRTRAGTLYTDEAEFSVAVRGDTTDVEVHRPRRRSFLFFVPLPTAVELTPSATGKPSILGETRRARLVRGDPASPHRLTEPKEP